MRRRSALVTLLCVGFGAMVARVTSGVAAPNVAPPSIEVALDAPSAATDDVLQGSSIARSPGGARVYVADAPNQSVFVLSTASVGAIDSIPSARVALQGAPGQLVAYGDRVLVALRDPSALVVFHADEEKGLVEDHRVALADDAGGLAVTPDHSTALVTSAWSHRVSAVDLQSFKVRWSIDVPREPRAVAVRNDGKEIYVSHLTSSDLTTIENLDGKPIVHGVPLSVAVPFGTELSFESTLGWSLTLSDDGTRLFAPRRALGGDFQEWNGAFTVDVLQTTIERPLVDEQQYETIGTTMKNGELPNAAVLPPTHAIASEAPLADHVRDEAIVPRASIYRRKARTLLVASEGTNVLWELDARSLAPALQRLRKYDLGQCVDPDGIALSLDASIAFVHCAASFDVRRVPLLEAVQPAFAEPTKYARSVYAADPLDPVAALGRKLFFDATDDEISGGYPCSGCHPEGRDDGHVWALMNTMAVDVSAYGGNGLQPTVLASGPNIAFATSVPRQTPMLAGRVAGKGPYGWSAEAPTLVARIEEGMLLHRWFFHRSDTEPVPPAVHDKALALAAFLRVGLVAPPSKGAPLDAMAVKGKELFEGRAHCNVCHTTTNGASPGGPYHVQGIGDDPFDGYDAESDAFKVPTLRFIGGTAPYYHDGSAPTLEALIDEDHDHMGKTSDLNDEERAALVAYLRTL